MTGAEFGKQAADLWAAHMTTLIEIDSDVRLGRLAPARRDEIATLSRRAYELGLQALLDAGRRSILTNADLRTRH